MRCWFYYLGLKLLSTKNKDLQGKYTCYKEERKEGKFSDRCQGDKETNCHGETEERN